MFWVVKNDGTTPNKRSSFDNLKNTPHFSTWRGVRGVSLTLPPDCRILRVKEQTWWLYNEVEAPYANKSYLWLPETYWWCYVDTLMVEVQLHLCPICGTGPPLLEPVCFSRGLNGTYLQGEKRLKNSNERQSFRKVEGEKKWKCSPKQDSANIWENSIFCLGVVHS